MIHDSIHMYSSYDRKFLGTQWCTLRSKEVFNFSIAKLVFVPRKDLKMDVALE